MQLCRRGDDGREARGLTGKARQKERWGEQRSWRRRFGRIWRLAREGERRGAAFRFEGLLIYLYSGFMLSIKSISNETDFPSDFPKTPPATS